MDTTLLDEIYDAVDRHQFTWYDVRMALDPVMHFSDILAWADERIELPAVGIPRLRALLAGTADDALLRQPPS